MFFNYLKIATRRSPLALWQANYVKNFLINVYPKLLIKILPMTTSGDVTMYRNINNIPSKESFVKELELAILDKKADIAVHSMKDVPINFPKNLGIVAICKSDNPLDAFVSQNYNSLDSLPKGSIIGTSSIRRQFQINNMRPDLIIKSINGNIETRLSKLDSQKYDAIILAVAGLNRLGLKNRIKHIISAEKILPAAGQGAIGIECNILNHKIINLLSVINHKKTEMRVIAERAMNIFLKASCSMPIASYAILKNKNLWLRGVVGSIDGKKMIKEEKKGYYKNAKNIGIFLAKKLLKKGARNIINNL